MYCVTHDCKTCKKCNLKDVQKFNADAKKAVARENRKLVRNK